MAHAHDDAVIGFGGDGQLAGKGFALDDERVVARGGERVGELAENVFAVVVYLAGLAVEKFRSANDFASERRADGLMTQADTENREFPGQAANQIDANSGVLRRAGARRN